MLRTAHHVRLPVMLAWVRGTLRYVQTWLWIWGVIAAFTIAVVIWAVSTRLPGVVVFVLALGTGVVMLVGLESALAVYERVKALLGRRYQHAIAALERLRAEGEVLRSRAVTSEVEVKFFIAEVEVFEAAALAALQGAATPADISWFRDAPAWTLPPGVLGYNDEHAMVKAVLEEKLRRMHDIACRLEMKIAA